MAADVGTLTVNIKVTNPTWLPPEGMQGVTKEKLELLSQQAARRDDGLIILGAALPVELPGGGRPNSSFRYAFKKGMMGWDVYALQVALNSHQKTFPIVEDGIFGPQTHECVLREQKNHHVTVDGIIGPATQAIIARLEAKRAEGLMGVPTGLLHGLAVGESGLFFACVSGPNWNGSYDAGVIQDNLTASDIDEADKWHRGFDLRYGFETTGRMLASEYKTFRSRPGIQSDRAGWECALGNHNWPAAAAKVSYGVFDEWRYFAIDSTGVGRYYGVDDPAHWVIAASGGRLSTARQWWDAYIDSKTMFVTKWSV